MTVKDKEKKIKPCIYCGDRGWYSEVIKNPSYERNETGQPDVEPIWIKHSIQCEYCNARNLRKSYFIADEMRNADELVKHIPIPKL